MDHPDAVPERRGHEDRRIGSEPEPLRERHVEGGEGIAGVHDRLRPAGGAGGEHELVESLDRTGARGAAPGASRPRLRARLRLRARHRPAPGSVLGDDRHRRRDGPHPRGGVERERPGLGPAVPFDRDEGSGFTELRRVAKGVLVRADRQVGGNRAVPEHGEHRYERFGPIRHEEEDDVPRADSLPGKLRAEPAGFPPELPAAETPPPIVDDGGRVRSVLNEAVKALRERHARPPAALAVAPCALRVAGGSHGSRSGPRPKRVFIPLREPRIPSIPRIGRGRGSGADAGTNTGRPLHAGAPRMPASFPARGRLRAMRGLPAGAESPWTRIGATHGGEP